MTNAAGAAGLSEGVGAGLGRRAVVSPEGFEPSTR